MKIPTFSRFGFMVVVGLSCLLSVGMKESGITGKQLGRNQQHIAVLPDSLPISFGFGRPALTAEIEKLDIDIRPDGKGLPPGSGTVAAGKAIYDLKCAACHGVGGIGGPNGSLAMNPDPKVARREKVIGNYWPYASTIFDYVRRAMPFNQPGSLSDTEVYNLTAYLLHLNKIIDEKTVIDAKTLPLVQMPAQKLYVPDDRQGGPIIK